MAFLNAVRWVKHVRGTQQINDSHPRALPYEIDSQELENASHFAMRISLFSSLSSTLTTVYDAPFSGSALPLHDSLATSYECATISLRATRKLTL